MKSIGIVINEDLSLGELLKSNLLRVFNDFVEINIYRLQHLVKPYKIRDDVVLVMTKEKAIELFEYIDEREKIVPIERTITMEVTNSYKIVDSLPCS